MKYRATAAGLFLNGRSYSPREPIDLPDDLAASMLIRGEIELDIAPMVSPPSTAEATAIDATPRDTAAAPEAETTTAPRRGRPPRSR